jgi:predicted amidophosphoribosyltransferase
MDKPMEHNILYRVVANPSQTKKHRYQRWTNVKGIFAVQHQDVINHKHVLLVDDVVTTGATLEACAAALKTGKDVKVSIFALAKA